MSAKDPISDTTSLTMTADHPPQLENLILEREFPSDQALVIPMVVRVMDFLVEEGLVSDADRNRVGLCLEEALQNAVVHGNREDFKKTVKLRVFHGTKRWSIQVDDEGDGFRLESVPNPLGDENLWGEGGRGLSLIALYMDDVTYYRSGKTLLMSRNL
jgi:serine/threonine-protein kinase RsbW